MNSYAEKNPPKCVNTLRQFSIIFLLMILHIVRHIFVIYLVDIIYYNENYLH